MMTSDVCVVGGGPSGLAAALALTKSGREVTVLDCALPPIDKACGEGLMPDSVRSLRELGVNLPPDAGFAFSGIKFIGKEASVAADFPNGIGRGLRRLLLHQLLIEQAERSGVRMLWGVKDVHTRKGCVSYSGGSIHTSLIVGADGLKSRVRVDAGLDSAVTQTRRFGFRKHFNVAPWSPYVEVYWGAGFQIYVTPLAADKVCVALISRDAALRLDAALGMMPVLRERLTGANDVSAEKGSLTTSRRFRKIYTDGVVLLGDASGSADAITGEGLCLAFKQAAALVEALHAGDLRIYANRHKQLSRRPLQMAALLLLLDRNQFVQRRSLAALAQNQPVFASMLAAHVGHAGLLDVCSWQLLNFGLGFLAA